MTVAVALLALVTAPAQAAVVPSTPQANRTVPPPPGPPPPPVAVHVPGTPYSQRFLDYRAGDVRCGDTTPQATHREPVLAALTYPGSNHAPLRLRFRIDADGRPLSIAPDGEGQRIGNDDLMPSFAAWRFAPGKAVDGCSVTFYPVDDPVDQVAPERLQRFLALGGFRPGPRPPKALFDRARPRGDCTERWPQVLTQTFPRFDAIPTRPGTLAQTTIGFDIAADGTTSNIRVLSSDGNAALDQASMTAIGDWRYAEGPRQGCVYPYHRRAADPVLPPEAPEAAALRDPTARCDVDSAWDRPPGVVFPEPYRKRATEGWAVIAYDVAPWGELGNVRVLASEPTSEFGDAAKRVVMAARKAPAATGASGCTQTVRFRMER